MAKCDLSIELADPNRIYATGEQLRGTVVVRAHADTKCNGLLVSTPWRTHGRGNIDQNKGDTESLFQGDLEAGREYRFDFDLPINDGPSTYHGHYLNIDHYIKAQLDVPWAFDPKTETSFRYVQLTVDDHSELAEPSVTPGCVKVLLGIFIFGFAMAGLLLQPIILLVGGLVLAAAGTWWFFRRFLPARALGQVTHEFDRHRIAPGEAIAGQLTIHPPQELAIEGVKIKVSAIESCTSGSGTNSTTHRHTAFEQTWQVAPPGKLPGGEPSHLRFEAELPERALYSVSLSDNKLTWTGELRVAIPRWPDWVRSYSFVVLPPMDLAPRNDPPPKASDDVFQAGPASLLDRLYPGSGDDVFADTDDAPPPTEVAALAAAIQPATPPETPQDTPLASPPSAVTFAETVQMIWAQRDDQEQRDRIIAALNQQTMPMEARVQRREFFGGIDEHAYENGYSYRAVGLEKSIALTLFIRHDQASEFEQLGGTTWQGEGAIVGFCDRRNRILIRVE